MIQSMTGYGKAVAEVQNKKITIEVKSLNSKQLDLNTRICGYYRSKELEIRSLIAQKIGRGKVDFSLQMESLDTEQTPRINQDMLTAYYEQIKQISAQTGIAEPTDWYSVLLRMPDVYKNEQKELTDQEWAEAALVLDQAIEAFTAFRSQEGKGLQAFFMQKINNIRALLAEVPQYENARVEKIRARLEENLRALDDKITYDANRLEQELIFYIEKLDISEEKQRLNNHLNYFVETMDKDPMAGKKLGFIAQEMGREINTLGSKANHSELQIIVVKMKDELEQIKEQVLNVL